MHAMREPERFFDILRSWDSQAWAVTDGEVFLGYLVASKTGEEIHELVLVKPELAADVVAAWLNSQGAGQVSVMLAPFDREGVLALSRLAETMRVEAADNMAVFRFDTTVNAFFKLRASYDALPEGALVMAVEGHPAFRMEVSDGVARAAQTDAPANLTLSYTDALALLFSPLGGVCASALETGAGIGPAGFGERERALIRAWLPLPLYFDKADNV